jgi:hypothetical protein
MQIIKSFITLLVFSFVTIHAQSQFSLSATGGLRTAVEKVLNAYKNQFASIQGDTLSVTSEAEIFASTVKPDGNSICTLTRYLQPGEAVYSWEALILRTEDFAAASKKYHACYTQLKGIAAKTSDGHFKFEGDFEPTSNANKGFYSTLLSPGTELEPYRKLRLEILLEADITEWTLRVLVYDNGRKDTEGSMGR